MDARFDLCREDAGKGISRFLRIRKIWPKLLAAGLIWLPSCMPDPLDVDDFELPPTRIVVSSMILPDQSVAVLLTKSIGALEASDESDPRELISDIAINDATVTLTVDGEVYPLNLLQDGVYQGIGIPLVEGLECHLNVVSGSYGKVSASTTVQAPIYFDTVKAEPYVNEHNQYWAEVTYTIKDPPTPNYYLLNVQKAKRKDLVENILKPEAYTRQVEDKKFNAQEFSEMFRAMHKDFYPGDSLEVSLSNVSLDYFKYVGMRLENRLELVEVFSEPVYYPTNVRGGRGFFTLHLTDVRVVVL